MAFPSWQEGKNAKSFWLLDDNIVFELVFHHFFDLLMIFPDLKKQFFFQLTLFF